MMRNPATWEPATAWNRRRKKAGGPPPPGWVRVMERITRKPLGAQPGLGAARARPASRARPAPDQRPAHVPRNGLAPHMMAACAAANRRWGGAFHIAARTWSVDEQRRCVAYLRALGFRGVEFFDLGTLLPPEVAANRVLTREDPPVKGASVMSWSGFVDDVLGRGTHDRLKRELDGLEKDTAMYARTMKAKTGGWSRKVARGNLNFTELAAPPRNPDAGDSAYDSNGRLRRVRYKHPAHEAIIAQARRDQASDSAAAKRDLEERLEGLKYTNYAFTPVAQLVRAALPVVLGPFGYKITHQYSELNHYHTIAKCGIGWHGDIERGIPRVHGGSVNCVKVGTPMPLYFGWFNGSTPRGYTHYAAIDGRRYTIRPAARDEGERGTVSVVRAQLWNGSRFELTTVSAADAFRTAKRGAGTHVVAEDNDSGAFVAVNRSGKTTWYVRRSVVERAVPPPAALTPHIAHFEKETAGGVVARAAVFAKVFGRGDAYFMSEHATGWEWQNRNHRYRLRHAAGFDTCGKVRMANPSAYPPPAGGPGDAYSLTFSDRVENDSQSPEMQFPTRFECARYDADAFWHTMPFHGQPSEKSTPTMSSETRASSSWRSCASDLRLRPAPPPAPARSRSGSAPAPPAPAPPAPASGSGSRSGSSDKARQNASSASTSRRFGRAASQTSRRGSGAKAAYTSVE